MCYPAAQATRTSDYPMDAPTRDPRGPALTCKQRRFVEEYCLHFNAARAARDAGYSERTARQQGSENLSKPAIRAAVEAEMERIRGATFISREQQLRDLRRLSHDERVPPATRLAALREASELFGLKRAAPGPDDITLERLAEDMQQGLDADGRPAVDPHLPPSPDGLH